MTDDKLSNISRAMAFTLIAFICLLVFLAKAFGQSNSPEKPDSSHDHISNRIARFRLIRIIPAKVTYIERNEQGTRIEYVAHDRNEIENGFFQATKETTGDVPKKGEWFWFSYCDTERHLYGLYRPTAEQLKVLK